jgi:tetratricopeptide (TPR) repeat protein
MFPEKFKALEEKIRLTAELVVHLKREKIQLEREKEEAGKRVAEGEQRIAELEGEIKRLRAERHPLSPPMDPLFQQFNTRHGDLQDQTAQRLMEALVKEPTNVKALFELGTVYERQGMYDQAIEEYRKVLKINPDFVEAIEHLAFLLEKLNRDNEASPLWERILSLKKRD